MNLETGRRTPFERADGIYELGMWVKPHPELRLGFSEAWGMKENDVNPISPKLIFSAEASAPAAAEGIDEEVVDDVTRVVVKVEFLVKGGHRMNRLTMK